jgi:enoyl-CoA hydratase/carnithine racemase
MTLVLAETRGPVGVARLNRPEARNALSPELMDELAVVAERWDADPEVRCIVIAGGDEWFAAGADIKAMAERTFVETLNTPAARFWPRLAAVRAPLIAAVSGYALGGGCELALLCDMIVASETAELGQPEILLGIIPGGGGTQRWLEAALELAEIVARRPPLAVRLGKQAVLAADETPLTAGLDQERRLYELAMATEDRVEGMNAFIEKRRPEFRGR